MLLNKDAGKLAVFASGVIVGAGAMLLYNNWANKKHEERIMAKVSEIVRNAKEEMDNNDSKEDTIEEKDIVKKETIQKDPIPVRYCRAEFVEEDDDMEEEEICYPEETLCDDECEEMTPYETPLTLEEREVSRPRIVEYDEFEELRMNRNAYGYDLATINVYTNGVVISDNGDVMTDDEIEDMITLDALNQFPTEGDFEDELMIVNDKYKLLIEVEKNIVPYVDPAGRFEFDIRR